jgi:hypothetical protein
MTSHTVALSLSPEQPLAQTALAATAQLFQLAFSNLDRTFECAQRLLQASTRSEFEVAMTDTVRGQFEAISESVETFSIYAEPRGEDLTLLCPLSTM